MTSRVGAYVVPYDIIYDLDCLPTHGYQWKKSVTDIGGEVLCGMSCFPASDPLCENLLVFRVQRD